MDYSFILFWKQGPHYVALVSLGLTEIQLPLLPKCWV